MEASDMGIKDILDLLPPEEGNQRRKHNLTRNDLLLIDKMIEVRTSHVVCKQFTSDEVVIGRKLIGAFNGASKLIGSAVLMFFVVAILGFMSKGFWITLAKNITGGVK